MRLLLLVAALSMLVVSSAAAQEQASIQAVATVVSSLTVVGSNNLQFGTVTPGVTKLVDKATVGFAGEWQITGIASAEVAITFALPDSLHISGGTGAMRISFSPTDASYDIGTGSQSAPTGQLNPNGPSTRRLGTGGALTVWIGGTVYPRISQTGGDYSAEIMLTVSYTGG